MSRNERFVFDTNVLVSGVLFAESKPAQAFFLALRTGVLLTSLAALYELSIVLRRQKFDKYLAIEEREQFLDQYTRSTTTIEIIETIQLCRDPKDNTFLEIAVNGGATYLITGDPDLLVLHPFRKIPIISPDTFLQTRA
ncbi:MAG: putative toxin-antitoxin system toxin component, PIN family [Burkholderiales bacterium]